MKRTGWIQRRTHLRRKGRSRFPKRRNPEYKAWAYAHYDCAIRGRVSKKTGLVHRCWGDPTFAHMFDTQARGAYDVGEGVILCVLAHAHEQGRTEAFSEEWDKDVRELAREMAERYGEEER